MSVLTALVFPALLFAGEDYALRETFESDQPAWEPYGSGCETRVVKDDGLKKNVLVARFDNSSPKEWCNKGAYWKCKPPLSWDQFDYCYFKFKISRSVGKVGCLVHDKAGHWWQCVQFEPFKLNEWQRWLGKKMNFTFAWNDDPAVTRGDKSSEIIELFIFAQTPEVNTGAIYDLTLSDVILSHDVSE
ncbi:MAG: hypothetical protein HY360_12005 [Verrucomicrobia bacterium]|nr:hypothetical protein [Verrucomicrobiota bacterium]